MIELRDRKPWAGVVRVSHMGDRKPGASNVHADKDQVADLEAYAKRAGVRLKVLPPELDVSGGLPLDQRPSLRAAVEGIEAGTFGGVIVAYLSRLGRSVREQLAVWDRVEAAGGRIVVVRENLDTSTPNGRYVRTILLANAERELEEHTERFENLRQWATSAGIWQRRQTPRGYRRDPETRKLVPDERAEEVREVFRRRAAGETISQLARDLGMSSSGTRNLLRNRVYLGELHVGSHANPAAHPPLIDEEDWHAAQSIHGPSRPARSRAPISLLAGLVRCASCGHVMSRGWGGRGSRTYTCHREHSAGRCLKPAAITLATLNSHVQAIGLSQLAHLRVRAADREQDIAEARKRLHGAEQELAAYLDGVSAAGLGPLEYANGARTRRADVEASRDQLTQLLARGPGMTESDPVDAWQQMNPEQQNRLLRGLIECVIVAPAGRGRRVPITERVRIVAHGTGLVERYRGAGKAAPIRALTLPDLDDPAVLRMQLGEDLLEGTRG